MNLYFFFKPNNLETYRTCYNIEYWYLISIITPCEIVRLIKFKVWNYVGEAKNASSNQAKVYFISVSEIGQSQM